MFYYYQLSFDFQYKYNKDSYLLSPYEKKQIPFFILG